MTPTSVAAAPMFMTVQIRAPTQLVRRRTGEEVSNPIQEFEDGGVHQDGRTTFDLRHRTVDQAPTDLESFERPTEPEASGTEEQLVAATSAFSGQTHSEGHDLEDQKERRRRAQLDRPVEVRRLLSQMHALSMLARPAKETFIRHMDTGLAKLTLRVWRGALTMGGSVQSFPGVPAHLARGAAALGAGARLNGEGLLNPDGSINRLRLDVRLDALPALGPLDQAELDRLKAIFIHLHADGIDPSSHAGWAAAHDVSARRRPELPLMLLVALLTDLERQAVGLLGGPKPAGRDPSMMTLQDVLEDADDEDAATDGARRPAETRLTWLDDTTPALDVEGCPADQLTALNDAFRRVLAYLPQAWRRCENPSEPPMSGVSACGGLPSTGRGSRSGIAPRRSGTRAR